MVNISDSTNYTDSQGLATAVVNASAGHFWIWTLVATCIALACGYGLFYFIRRARIIEDTPTSRIRSAPQGYVEIIGQIQYFANEAVIAPLTKLPCAWYHFKIEKKETVHTGKSSHTRWNTIEEATSNKVFICVDDSGQCVIDPRAAEVHVNDEDTWYGDTKWPQSLMPAKQGIFSTNNYRYQEQRLLENERLYAIGQFKSIDPNKAHGDVSDEVRAILKVWKTDQKTLLERYDTNRDGQIDLKEWETVRQAATQQAYQQRLARADRPTMHMLGKTDDFRRPYILSAKPPENMTKKFKLKAFACLLGIVTLAPLSLWLIIVRLST